MIEDNAIPKFSGPTLPWFVEDSDKHGKALKMAPACHEVKPETSHISAKAGVPGSIHLFTGIEWWRANAKPT